MRISDFLAVDDVMIDVDAEDKAGLLRWLCMRAASRLALPEQLIWQVVSNREALGSTGVGGGIALPHARIEGLTRTFALLARLERPMPFEAIDEQPVDLVILLLSPEGEAAASLACVARRLRESETAARLREATSAQSLYRVLSAEAA